MSTGFDKPGINIIKEVYRNQLAGVSNRLLCAKCFETLGIEKNQVRGTVMAIIGKLDRKLSRSGIFDYGPDDLSVFSKLPSMCVEINRFGFHAYQQHAV